MIKFGAFVAEKSDFRYNVLMLAISLISWWYGLGFKKRIDDLTDSFRRTLDYFSIGLLIKTLFAPFRQISASKASGAAIDIRFRMFLDRLISRIVGSFMRTIVVLIGIVVIVIKFLISLVVIVFHLLLPVLPIVGIVMMIIGWIPSWHF